MKGEELLDWYLKKQGAMELKHDIKDRDALIKVLESKGMNNEVFAYFEFAYVVPFTMYHLSVPGLCTFVRSKDFRFCDYSRCDWSAWKFTGNWNI